MKIKIYILIILILSIFAYNNAKAQTHQYLNFDGIKDYINVPNASSLVTGSVLSITGWFYDNTLDFGQGMMGFRSTTEAFYLISSSNGSIEARFVSSLNYTSQPTIPSNTIVTNTWQHYAFVFDGMYTRFYLNGNLVSSALASGIGTLSMNTIPFIIGRSPYQSLNFYYNGSIDEVSLWRKALTQAQILDIMNNEISDTAQGLQLYYKFNQGIPGGNNTNITKIHSEINSPTYDGDIVGFTLIGDTSNFKGNGIYGPDSVSQCQSNVIYSIAPIVNATTYVWSLPNGASGISNTDSIIVKYGSNAQSGVIKVVGFNNNIAIDSLSLPIIVNTFNFNLTFTVNQTLFTAPPFTVQYTNTTPNMSAYNFTWNFGDGGILNSNNPSVFHTYSFNGLYSVSLIATQIANTCPDTLLKPDYIYCSGGISCNYPANILESGPITKCQGDSVFLSCNTDATYTYQWKLNGTPINGATNSQTYVHQSGAYSVTISQISTGCAITSLAIQLNFNSLAIPQILTTGNVNPCTSDSLKLYTPLSYNSYQWSTGATTPFIYVMQTGIYSLTVTDANNCSASSLYDTINTSYLATQQICLVGVDTASNKNIIIWNKPVSTVISAYKIYKESTAADVYNVIATQPYSTLSKYIDQSSNPTTKADRYKISAVDTCGSETLISSFHKTNHLTINQGVGTNWNLIWDGYEGFTFPTYNIYRGTTSATMTNIGSIQSNLTSYTDNPGVGVYYYMIEVVDPNACNPSKSMNSSLSNIIQTTNVGINEHAVDGLNFKFYPNPVSKELIIELEGNKDKVSFEIFNSIGQSIYKGNMIEKTTVQTTSFAQGVYIIKLENGKVFEFKKIVKE